MEFLKPASTSFSIVAVFHADCARWNRGKFRHSPRSAMSASLTEGLTKGLTMATAAEAGMMGFTSSKSSIIFSTSSSE